MGIAGYIVYAILCFGFVVLAWMIFVLLPIFLSSGSRAFGIIAGFAAGIVVGAAFEIRIVFLICVSLIVALSGGIVGYDTLCIAMSIYLFALSITYLAVGIVAEKVMDHLKEVDREMDDPEDGWEAFYRQTISNLMFARVAMGMYGFVGLVFGFSFSLYTLDLTSGSGLGQTDSSMGEYILFAMGKILSAISVDKMFSYLFGVSVVAYTIPEGNGLSIFLEMIFSVINSLWLFAFFVVSLNKFEIFSKSRRY